MMQVLVLAGEPVAGLIVCRLLECTGFSAYPAENVADALEALATAQFDALVIDLDDLDAGLVHDLLLRRLFTAAETPPVPVIGVCRKAELRWQHCRADGLIDRLLFKPLSACELSGALALARDERDRQRRA
jgi:CheY-like chemotaxis protein